MINIESIFVAIGLLFTAYELHLNRRSEYIRIAHEYKNRYDTLSETRRDLFHFYLEKDFDLEKIRKTQPEIYDRIVSYEVKYMWLTFHEWLEGYVRKSIPRYIRKDWDYAIKSAFSNPVHQQVWKTKLREMDFWGYREFNKYIDEAIEKGKNARL